MVCARLIMPRFSIVVKRPLLDHHQKKKKTLLSSS